jgi:hypothetical protein
MQSLPLAPRYRLDDESPWLEGIDPSRHYWIWVNGESSLSIPIPGLVMLSPEQFRETILEVRRLQPGQHLELQRAAVTSTIHCISPNCYAIAGEVNGAPVWHLFDQETLESLLMTGHPDWKCAPKDVELGRRLLLRSWEQTIAA